MEKAQQRATSETGSEEASSLQKGQWAAIFDWDGVLIDSADRHLESWHRLAREEGKPLPPDFFLPSFGKTNNWIIPQILRWTEDPQEISRLGARKEALYREVVAEQGVSLYPAAVAFCASLARRSVPMAIASSTARANIELTLAQTHLRHFFRTIVSAEDVQRGKPDPEVFLLAAQRLGFTPERCVVFEDAPAGVEAAKRAGMWAIAVTTTNPAEALQRADRTLPSFVGLTAVAIEEWFFS
ncbi:HAD family hydrolase [Acidithiobacillus sp. M4-SHS-6]|uniref:HAD family hydrolase n=1 Tax=Acidithiobacillus sp. M4-SHS-6 TaxID=3383024 RepID=UPI0039BE3735